MPSKTTIFFIFAFMFSGSSIGQNLILPILPAGDSIIVVSGVTINFPPSGLPTTISKQHTISGTNFLNILSNDPKTTLPNDPTITNVVVMGPVPVTLSRIRAYRKNTGIEVEWIVQQESNMEKYEVERSENGQVFHAISSVSSRGYTATPVVYDLFDANPLNGWNFYRIRCVDFSGEITYSQIVRVKLEGGETKIAVTPNPIEDGRVVLSLENLEKGVYILSLINSRGQQLIERNMTHPGGSVKEYITFGSRNQQGMYIIRIKGKGVEYSERFIKR